MKNRPTVSVLMTVYNREEYIAEAIQSVLGSSFQDFEFLIVDDGSTDNSLKIAESFGAVDGRIRILRNATNLGDYPNRNHAASLASGEFLKYVDSDDVIYPHSLGVMVDAMREHPEAAIGLSHSIAEEIAPYPWRLSPVEAYRKHFLDRGCLNCGPSGAIICREQFEKMGGFHESWGVLSDNDLWLRLAANWDVVLLPPGLVWWRRHEGQEFTSGDASTKYLRRGFELSLQSLDDANCPLPQDECVSAVRRVKQHHARRLISLAVKSGKPLEALQLLRDSQLTYVELLQGLRCYRT